jgi:hypothetical protein
MYSIPMQRDFKVIKLSDEFGQYTILLRCDCGHTRRCYPQTLAAISGWEAKLDDLVRRMRCSKCGEKKCTAKAMPLIAPRGHGAIDRKGLAIV